MHYTSEYHYHLLHLHLCQCQSAWNIKPSPCQIFCIRIYLTCKQSLPLINGLFMHTPEKCSRPDAFLRQKFLHCLIICANILIQSNSVYPINIICIIRFFYWKYQPCYVAQSLCIISAHLSFFPYKFIQPLQLCESNRRL